MKNTACKKRDKDEIYKLFYDMSSDNSDNMSRLKRRVLRAMKKELTDKQLKTMTLYYYNGCKMSEIAQMTGVCRSTVSRTIRRGNERLRKCLKYGAFELLDGE